MSRYNCNFLAFIDAILKTKINENLFSRKVRKVEAWEKMIEVWKNPGKGLELFSPSSGQPLYGHRKRENWHQK